MELIYMERRYSNPITSEVFAIMEMDFQSDFPVWVWKNSPDNQFTGLVVQKYHLEKLLPIGTRVQHFEKRIYSNDN